MTSEGDAHKQQAFSFSANPELKQPIILDEPAGAEEQAAESLAPPCREGLDTNWKEAVPDSSEIESELRAQVSAAPVSPPKRHRFWWFWLKLVALLAVVLSVAESVNAFNRYWLQSPVMAEIFAAFILLLLFGCLTLIFHEWRKLNALQQLEVRRDTSKQILSGETADAIQSYCNSILPARLQEQLVESVNEWDQAQQPHHSDAERLSLYEGIVLKQCDQAALAVVARWSAEAGILVGASPLAALDLLFIVWRNTRMLDAIASCYGLELGLFSRLKLMHMVLFNLAFVGASEVSIDIGVQSLGADVVTRLSGRLAQGMGAGLLSARLGLKAMQLCRPMDFDQQDSLPSLRDVSRELRTQLLQRLKTDD